MRSWEAGQRRRVAPTAWQGDGPALRCGTPAQRNTGSRPAALSSTAHPTPLGGQAGPWPGSLANHSTAAVVRAGLNRFDSLPHQLAELPGGGGSGGIDAEGLPLRELDLSYNNLTVGALFAHSVAGRCAYSNASPSQLRAAAGLHHDPPGSHHPGRTIKHGSGTAAVHICSGSCCTLLLHSAGGLPNGSGLCAQPGAPQHHRKPPKVMDMHMRSTAQDICTCPLLRQVAHMRVHAARHKRCITRCFGDAASCVTTIWCPATRCAPPAAALSRMRQTCSLARSAC